MIKNFLLFNPHSFLLCLLDITSRVSINVRTVALRFSDTCSFALKQQHKFHVFSILKTVVHRNSLRISQETHHVSYTKDQPGKSVRGNNRCLLWEPYETYNRMQSLSMLKQAVHIVTTELQSLKRTNVVSWEWKILYKVLLDLRN
jgi:hypothetical protein